jgi:hypothetical protein
LKRLSHESLALKILIVAYDLHQPARHYPKIVDREVPAPPGGLCRDRKEWAEGLGAVDAAFTRIQVTLEGRSPGAVVINGIRAEVVARRPPLAGTG